MKNKTFLLLLSFVAISLFSTKQLSAQTVTVESSDYNYFNVVSKNEHVFIKRFYFAINLHGQNILYENWRLKVILDSPIINAFGKEIKNKDLEDIELRVNESSIGEEKEVEMKSLFGNGQYMVDKDMSKDYPLATGSGYYKRIVIYFDFIVDLDEETLEDLASSSPYMFNFTFSLLDSKGNPIGEPVLNNTPIALHIHEHLAKDRRSFSIEVNARSVTLELNQAEHFNTGISHEEKGGLTVFSDKDKFDLFVHTTSESFIDNNGYTIPVNKVNMRIDGGGKKDGDSQGEQPLSIIPTNLFKGDKTKKNGTTLDVYYTVPPEKAQTLMDERKGNYTTTVTYTMIAR